MEHFAVGLRIKSVIQVDPVVYVDGVQFIFMMKLAPEAIFVVYQTENDCNQSNVMILSKKFVSRILLPDVSNGNHRGKSLELITPNLFWDCMRREREKKASETFTARQLMQKVTFLCHQTRKPTEGVEGPCHSC